MNSFRAMTNRIRKSNHFHTLTGTVFGFSVSYAWEQYKHYEKYTADSENVDQSTFGDQVTYSINTVEQLPPTHPSGKKLALTFRTLKEQNLEDSFPNNSALLEEIRKKCKVMNPKHPWVNLGGIRQKLLFLSVINEVSELYVDGYSAAAMSLPTVSQTFKVGMSYECEPDTEAAKKLRVMMISDESLRLIKSASEQDILLERPSHEPRIRTLQCMTDETFPVVGDVVITLRAAAAAPTRAMRRWL